MGGRELKPPERCETMAELRAGIDALDGELIALLARRAAHVERAIVLKPREGIAAAAPDRVREVLAGVRGKAAEAGLSPDLAERLWSEMIAFFIAREEEVLGKGRK
jgi:isochorismate pyruvate lyase